MHCRVNEASNTNSLHLFTNNTQYYSLFLLFLCHTYQVPTAAETCKKVVKRSLKPISRLDKPADLSQISRLAIRQLSKPAEEGPHNSAWGLIQATDLIKHVACILGFGTDEHGRSVAQVDRCWLLWAAGRRSRHVQAFTLLLFRWLSVAPTNHL